LETLSLNSDAAVVDAIRSGSYQAFERTFKTYYGALCGFAMGYLKDKDSSEEAVQHIFFNFWEKRESIQITSSLKSYLYQSTRNHCLNVLKHEQVKTKAHVELTHDERGEENEIEAAELSDRIENAIAELPVERQRIFRMSRFEELKYKEIAEKLNISVKTVENQMGKALKHLRQALADVLPIILWFWIIFFKNE